MQNDMLITTPERNPSNLYSMIVVRKFFNTYLTSDIFKDYIHDDDA